MQALDQGAEIEREELHKRELTTALSTSTYANSQKLKPPYFSHLDFCFYNREERINSEICNAFFSLTRDETLPSWALEFAPVDELRKNTTNKPVPTPSANAQVPPRAWMCRGLALLLPQVDEWGVSVGMAIASDTAPYGKVTLWDVDTNESWFVVVPPLEPGALIDVKWMLSREIQT